MSENRGNEGRAGYKSKPHLPGNERKEVTELLVQIPLSELPQKIKPQVREGGRGGRGGGSNEGSYVHVGRGKFEEKWK